MEWKFRVIERKFSFFKNSSEYIFFFNFSELLYRFFENAAKMRTNSDKISKRIQTFFRQDIYQKVILTENKQSKFTFFFVFFLRRLDFICFFSWLVHFLLCLCNCLYIFCPFDFVLLPSHNISSMLLINYK